MGSLRRHVLVVVAAGGLAVLSSAAAAPGVRLSLAHGPGRPEVGRAVAIVVRATRPHANVRIWIARGRTSRSFATRAQSQGRYRARVAFPTAGRWTFGARADGVRVRLGSVRVRAVLVSDTGHKQVKRIDLETGQVETWGDLGAPRGIDIAPDGTVYIVDASTHRVIHLLVDGRRLGSVKHVFSDPYDVAAGGDGSVYVIDTAASGRLYRVAPSGTTTVVSRRG